MSGPFHPTAHVYDVVYGSLDYEESASIVEGIVAERCPGARSLLDVACGTGRHLEIFRDRFDEVAGIDIDPAMVEIARSRAPGASVVEADFTRFDLGRSFDAVVCLFSSIGYAHTPGRLESAVAAMAGHLAPGGVLVVEPWLRPEMVGDRHRIRSLVAEGEGITVLRTARWLNPDTALDEGVSRMEFAYLVTTPRGSDLLVEQHTLGLHPAGRYVAALDAAGLEGSFLEPGTALERGLAIGVAPV